MKLSQAFVRLPLRFDATRLRAEIDQFGAASWRTHPQGHKGNSGLPLIAVHGDPANEDTRGPMRATPALERCPYLMQTLSALDVPLGRTRLMRIEGHGEATAHVDTNYYWSQRVRIHIPILTYPGVRFLCGDQEAFMDNGECWIFDTWRSHNVLNPDDRPRIHLVADTVGSESFWDLVAQGDQPSLAALTPAQAHPVPYQANARAALTYEDYNFPTVMSPWEINWIIDQLLSDLPARQAADAELLERQLRRFLHRWQALWSRYGDASAGRPAFRHELHRLDTELGALSGRLRLRNNVDPVVAVNHWISRAAVAPEPLEALPLAKPQASPSVRTSPSRIAQPIFIVAAPRSGSSLLFETMARAANLYTIGGESHALIEGISALSPANREYDSNRLTATDATAPVVAALHESFWQRLHDRDGRRPQAGSTVRLLEKTPKNALRIPFLAAAFPDARFIYLYREPHESLASIIEAWSSGKFVTYPRLPEWQGMPWSLLLIPEWRKLIGKPLAEIATAQWEAANRYILDDLAALPADRWCSVRYDQLLNDPQSTLARLCQHNGLVWDQTLDQQLPLARHTLTAPAPEKWRAHAAEIEPLLPRLQGLAQRAATTLADKPAAPVVPPTPPAAANVASQPALPPLRSVHTTSFPELLNQLGISLMVTTYQAGRLVILRADNGLLNTHFRVFNKPMGMALHNGQLVIGTDLEIRTFHNIPAHTRQLSPPEKHDACFLPKQVHTTGDIQIHEMAWGDDQLWFVNTRFSCLCTYDPRYSFVPRWRPSFISALAPEDRCHLNGLAMVAGKPRYMTALGATDTPQGWRDQKRDGGLLLDIETDQVVARGLSMPHSPRWYAGKLWVLNSGAGGVGIVDPADGRYQEIARLPGFTRGIDFHGKYAFIGLSQVRESAIFSGIAIADLPVEQRSCGIWVIDITTGRTVAFVRFEDAVQEIFAIQVLAGTRYPELIHDDRILIARAFVLPEEALEAVAPSSRH